MERALGEDWQTMRRLVKGRSRDSDQLRARHLSAVLAVSPWVLAATLVNVAISALVLRGLLADAWLAAWVGGMALLCASGLAGWWRARRRPLRAVPVKLVGRATLNAALFALLWACLPLFWFPLAPPPQQLFLAVLITGMLAGGAMALAMLPPAAIAYVLLLTLGSMIGLWRSGHALAPLIQALLFVYAMVLLLASWAVMRLFTRRVASEREAARHSELVGLLLRDFEETTADVLWEVERSGRFVQVSERLVQLLERPAAKLNQLGLLQLLGSLQVEGSQGVERLRTVMERGEAFRDQVLRISTSQGTRWWSLTAKPLHDAEGRPAGWRGVISDVTAERKSHQHLTFLAHFDSLTGLANRVSLRNRLAQAIEQAQQPSARRSALMCMDLDNFKGINDSLGHTVGDAVLQEMAQRIRQHMRKGDLCGRLGGDEFAVVVDDVHGDEEVTQLAQRMVAAMRVPVQAMGLTVASGVSIGICFLPEHARSVDEALVAADLALHAAKDSGRGRVHVFTEQLGASQKRRMNVERELRDALLRNQIQVLYQPQVDIDSWQIVGAEALVRWEHPQLGSVSPVEFIGVAEESGLIHNIGAWVIDRACSDANHWLRGLRIAVNVSPSQVKRASLVGELRAQLQRHKLPPDRLELEITESLLMENVDGALENLHAIKQLGVRIALDDFGTGYSSLAYLRLFPFDKLKIDRAFIRELMQESDARAIVRTMLELARVLGMETLAEGVEEPAQLEVLQRVGCSAMQGFLVARPLSAPDLADLIERWPSLPRPSSADSMPASMVMSLR
ncbi:MAG: putative bifunctional diguanylate cyclase/phosphodiesterase [Inhella sp.]